MRSALLILKKSVAGSVLAFLIRLRHIGTLHHTDPFEFLLSIVGFGMGAQLAVAAGWFHTPSDTSASGVAGAQIVVAVAGFMGTIVNPGLAAAYVLVYSFFQFVGVIGEYAILRRYGAFMAIFWLLDYGWLLMRHTGYVVGIIPAVLGLTEVIVYLKLRPVVQRETEMMVACRDYARQFHLIR